MVLENVSMGDISSIIRQILTHSQWKILLHLTFQLFMSLYLSINPSDTPSDIVREKVISWHSLLLNSWIQRRWLPATKVESVVESQV